MPDTKISADTAATTTAGAEIAGIQGGANVRIPAGLLQQSVRMGTVTQAAHGFVAGDVLKLSGTTWSKAIATSVANATAIAVVESVTTNAFVPVLAGRITLSGLTAGLYYLSDATAGLLTLTAPTTATSYLVPVLKAVSATDAYVEIGTPLTLSAITSGDINDFAAAARAQVEAMLTQSTNITLTPSGTGASRQIAVSAAGGGGGAARPNYVGRPPGNTTPHLLRLNGSIPSTVGNSDPLHGGYPGIS